MLTPDLTGDPTFCSKWSGCTMHIYASLDNFWHGHRIIYPVTDLFVGCPDYDPSTPMGFPKINAYRWLVRGYGFEGITP